jgi:cytochrome d ubiquinol oxidase subunit I
MDALAASGIPGLWPQLAALSCATLLPLVAGLPPIVAIIESTYVMTQREIWKQMARFWGKLFGIALLAWTLGSLLLAILYLADRGRIGDHVQGLASPTVTVFFLPFALAAGLLLWNAFRDWWSLGQIRHLLVTWAWVPLSALAVLNVAIGYGLLDNPAGAALDPATLRMRIDDLPALLLNPAAQSRFVHTLGACYLTAATVVLSVSAWYLLRNRNVRIARRSLTVAASFGLAAALSVAVLGERNGYAGSPGQQMRIAAIAAEWHTRDAPAPFTLFGFPDSREYTTRAAVEVPWLLGLAATHSWRQPVAGIDRLEQANAARIRRGSMALATLDTPLADPSRSAVAGDLPPAGGDDLAYGLLLLRHTGDPARADAPTIVAAARDTVPDVPLLFWSFRAMTLLGTYAIVLFACAFWLASKRRLDRRVFLRVAACSLPVPWIAGALGWIVSEAGRGAWLVDGLLPITETHLGRTDAIIGAIGCAGTAILAVAGAILIARVVRLGPEGLGFWPMDSGRAGRY